MWITHSESINTYSAILRGRRAMQYQLGCECGDWVTVDETAAGTSALGRCARTIISPSLREMRRQTGLAEPALSPECNRSRLGTPGRSAGGPHLGLTV